MAWAWRSISDNIVLVRMERQAEAVTGNGSQARSDVSERTAVPRPSPGRGAIQLLIQVGPRANEN
jgi:hypothetical protein